MREFFYAGHADCPHCAAPIAPADREAQTGTLAACRAMDFLRDRLGDLGDLGIALAHDEDASPA